MSAWNGEPPPCSGAEERTTRTRSRGSATYVPEPARPSRTLWEFTQPLSSRSPWDSDAASWSASAGRTWTSTSACSTCGSRPSAAGVCCTTTIPRGVADSAGLRVIRLHDARHGCATLLTAAGVAPRVVMEILGHSQISITMDVYTHVVQDTQREAISHMDRLLKRRPGRP